MSPGMVTSSELVANAQSRVAVGGKQRAWWMKCACSAAVDVASMLAAMAIGRALAVACSGMRAGDVVRGMIHRLVHVHLLLHRIVLPWCVIVHPIFVKRTSHPAFINVKTETRECNASPGMMCACCAAAGSIGRLSKQVWVDCTCVPLESRATRGLSAGCMLVVGAFGVRKLLVAPESRMAKAMMKVMSMLTV